MSRLLVTRRRVHGSTGIGRSGVGITHRHVRCGQSDGLPGPGGGEALPSLPRRPPWFFGLQPASGRPWPGQVTMSRCPASCQAKPWTGNRWCVPACGSPFAACVRPLGGSGGRAADSQAANLGEVLQPLLGVVRHGLRMVETRWPTRRLSQLEAMLEIANRWNRTREVGPLLEQMAEAARAARGGSGEHLPLGPADQDARRPPGPGGRTRAARPDDRGVVGQVVRSGQPLRVDSMTEPERINRQVDQAGYKTRTILCVPLPEPVGGGRWRSSC